MDIGKRNFEGFFFFHLKIYRKIKCILSLQFTLYKDVFAGDRFGWVVCVAGVFLNLFRTIPPYCFGVFIAEYKKIYDRPMVELGLFNHKVNNVANQIDRLKFKDKYLTQKK